MTKNLPIKLMALTAMSFLFTQPSFSQENSSAKQAQQEASSALNSAQRELHKHSIGLGLGQTFLMGRMQDYGDNRITPDLFYSYSASYSFDFLANIHSSEHSYKNRKAILRGLAFSIKGRPYEFDSFSPYVLAGVGFYQPQIERGDQSSDIKETFGINAGAGVDLKLNRHITVGILGQYHNPFNIKQDDMPDVRGSYFKLLLTTMYLF